MPTRQDSSGIFEHAPLGRMFNMLKNATRIFGTPKTKVFERFVPCTKGCRRWCQHYFYFFRTGRSAVLPQFRHFTLPARILRMEERRFALQFLQTKILR